mgnify:CR=1 FL=1
MDEYQEVIWNTLDDYHQRLWAPTVGMHGPWNDYQLIKYEKLEPFLNSFYRNIWSFNERQDLKQLEAIIKEGYEIEDHEQRKQALEKTITKRVREVAKSLYLQEKETLDYIGRHGTRYPGRYFDEQKVQALKRKWQDL